MINLSCSENTDMQDLCPRVHTCKAKWELEAEPHVAILQHWNEPSHPFFQVSLDEAQWIYCNHRCKSINPCFTFLVVLWKQR